jgi:hypothetical protein
VAQLHEVLPHFSRLRVFDRILKMQANLPTSATLAIALGIIWCACSAQPVAPHLHSGGIWKAAVPPTSMKGEFDNLDPLGVAAGARIAADCSLNWIDPDDGKLYCFASGTSLEFFLDRPQANIQRARAGWQRLSAQQP